MIYSARVRKTTECIYDTQGVRGKISEIYKAVNLF